MKTLTDHTIIYDDECPLCNAYTSAFVKTGVLDSRGREPYTKVVNQSLPNVDWKRARNEIALVNRKDNTVVYGIDSLMMLIGYGLPITKRLFQLKPFRYMMNILYSFISYNRKAIMPAKVFEGENACTPDMHYAYRIAYILFAWLITSFVLVHFTRLMIPVVPASNFTREFIVCGGQIVFQGIILVLIKRDRFIHYIGNMMTISLAGAVFLMPAFLLTGIVTSAIFFIGYFTVVVGLMFLEHLRRVSILGLPWYISASWAFYRLLVLMLILFL